MRAELATEPLALLRKSKVAAIASVELLAPPLAHWNARRVAAFFF
jgi:hypothetical protein